MRKAVLRICALIFALGVVICSGILIWRSVSLKRAEAKAAAVKEELMAQLPEAEPSAPGEALSSEEAQSDPARSDPMPAEDSEGPQATAEPEQAEDAPSANEAGSIPKQNAEPALLPKYESLAAQYPDFAGWITIGQDDVIDALVVRGSDNEFYLDHDFTGASAWGGAIFMDCQNALEPLSRNTILYGHHLADQFEDRMFGELMNYKEQHYAFENQTFYFASPYQAYEATIFACYSIYPSDWRLYSLEFSDDRDFLNYCSEAMEHSRFDFGVTIGPEDRIITLSTCDYTAEDYRFLVHAVLKPLD